ncbi:MAG: hypothetical protein HOO92_15610 [Methylococcaceae bacterium]|nr:hypothetical protein [Methylococcaceae bacterium]
MTINSTANRKTTPPIKVCCTPAERQSIIDKAEQCGLSVSNFLRAIGLGLLTHTLFDHRNIDQLLKTDAALGLVVGLLKLWLIADDNNRLDSNHDLRKQTLEAISEIDDERTAVKTFLQRLVRS